MGDSAKSLKALVLFCASGWKFGISTNKLRLSLSTLIASRQGTIDANLTEWTRSEVNRLSEQQKVLGWAAAGFIFPLALAWAPKITMAVTLALLSLALTAKRERKDE